MLRKEYAKELNGKLWGKHLWSPSYCVVSSDGAALEVVKDYIEQQRTPPSPKAIQRSAQAQQQHRTKKVRGALTRPTPERDCAPYESVQGLEWFVEFRERAEERVSATEVGGQGAR